MGWTLSAEHRAQQEPMEKWYNNGMLLMSWVQWWYGPGWGYASKRAFRLLKEIYLSMSVPILLRTLFAPWKRMVTASGDSLDAKVRAFGDNTVSRGVGFSVRAFMLLCAAILEVCVAIVGLAWILAWPFLPILAVIGIVKGLIG